MDDTAELELEARERLLAAGGRDHSHGAERVIFVVMADTDLTREFVLATCATAVFAEQTCERHGGPERTRVDVFGLLP